MITSDILPKETRKMTSDTFQLLLNSSMSAQILVNIKDPEVIVNARFQEWFQIPITPQMTSEVSEVLKILETLLSKPHYDVFSFFDLTSESVEEKIEQKIPKSRCLTVFNTPLIDANQCVVGRLFTINDMSKAKEIEEMKNEFVSMVSHELRTPLTTIKESVNIVLEGLLGPVSEKQQEILHLAKKDIKRLTTLVNDLLDVTQWDREEVQLHPQCVSLGKLLKDVHRSFRYQKELINHPIQLSEKCTQDVFCIGDPDCLTQVMINMIDNAIKYSPKPTPIQIGLKESEAHIEISITDFGLGIPKEEQSHIFKKFHRIKHVASQKIRGSGLGLSICEKIIHAHQGRILVESILDKGTTFTIQLPVLKDLRVLVVDDDEGLRQMYKTFFSTLNHWQVIEAATGREGVEKAQKHLPHIILLDVMMPEMNGYEVLGRLKESEETRSIPVILMSAYQIDDEKVQPSSSRSIMTLSKPFEVTKLKKCLYSMLTV